MAPQERFQGEKKVYLEGLMEAYCAVVPTGKFTKFWVSMQSGFLERWPVTQPPAIPVVAIDLDDVNPPVALTEVERLEASLSDAIAKLKQVSNPLLSRWSCC